MFARAGRYGLRGGPGGVAWCVSGRVCAPSSDTPRGLFTNSLMITGTETGEGSALRLVAGDSVGCLAQDVGAEIAARQVLIRLAAIAGGHPPDWLRDTSVFTPRVMTLIVERVDAHLRVRASLDEISSGFGLSPSHFARKFQKSTGLSLNRFMNRRRIGLALALLRTGRTPLAQLSLDLGFSSQSHFTRLFSGLTGLTPFQFRRAQRRMGE